MARIELLDVCKTLRDPGLGPGGTRADLGKAREFTMQHLHLTVPDEKTMVVLGPSGCGKSTLLRLIAGLVPVDSGQVLYDGVSVAGLSPGERGIGMVFQNYSLYPNLSSRDNVRSFFHFRRKTPELDELEREKLQRTCDLMGVELTQLFDRMPRTLSGGEQQRVAIARCVTRDARVFLVDEPFSNLDQQMRERYRVNLKMLLREYGVTTVYVTHDHNEAVVLADLVAVMGDGTIEQVGAPQEIYDRPRSAFVAGFLNIHGPGRPISFLDPQDLPHGGVLGDVRVGVRPDEVEVLPEPAEATAPGVIRSVLDLPSQGSRLLPVRVGSSDVEVRGSSLGGLDVGDRVWLRLRSPHLFDRRTGERVRTLGERSQPPTG